MNTDENTISNEIESAKKIFSGLDWEKLLSAVLVLVAGYIFVRVLCALFVRVLAKSGKLDASLRKYIVRIIKMMLFFILFIIVASLLGIPINSLITILASLGLAISLAMQDSLKNVAGGILLLSSKPFSTGDFIEIGAVSGTVQEVGVWHTILVTVDNKKVYIPNSKVSDDTVINYSMQDKRRIDLLFSVAYDCDLDAAQAVISDTIRRDERVLSEPEEPFVRVWELSPRSVEIMARIWCHAEDYWELRSAVLGSVKLAFDRAGIKIPHEYLSRFDAG